MSYAEQAQNPYVKAAVGFAEQEIEGFAIKRKADSWLMKLANRYARLFNPTFMTRFHTTIGSTMYLLDDLWTKPQGDIVVDTLLHEATHMHDRKTAGFWKYTAGYAMPQALALLALPMLVLSALLVLIAPERKSAWGGLVIGFLASLVLWSWLVSPWMLLFCLPLVALAPWPSPWRTKWERRGYQMSAAAELWMYGQIRTRKPDRMAEHFTGLNYYRMCPDETKVLTFLRHDIEDIESEKVLDDPWFKRAYEALMAVKEAEAAQA